MEEVETAFLSLFSTQYETCLNIMMKKGNYNQTFHSWYPKICGTSSTFYLGLFS